MLCPGDPSVCVPTWLIPEAWSPLGTSYFWRDHFHSQSLCFPCRLVTVFITVSLRVAVWECHAHLFCFRVWGRLWPPEACGLGSGCLTLRRDLTSLILEERESQGDS